MAAMAMSVSERPSSFLQVSAGRIGTFDLSGMLRLLEMTRQPALASCWTWSISTAGEPQYTPHTTTGSTSLANETTIPTKSPTNPLKDFRAAWTAGIFNSFAWSVKGTFSTMPEIFSSLWRIASMDVKAVSMGGWRESNSINTQVLGVGPQGQWGKERG